MPVQDSGSPSAYWWPYAPGVGAAPTVLSVAGTQYVTADITQLVTSSFAVPGDGGGWLATRAPSNPGHPGSFRTLDRYLPDGSTSAADGGWWVIVPDLVGLNPKQFGAPGDGSDQTTALDNWLATYDALATTLMSTNTVQANMPWLHVPAGRFQWAAGRIWNPQCGFAAIRGIGWQSVLCRLTVAIYNNQTISAGSAQFTRIDDVLLDGESVQPYGLVLGNPADWGGSSAGRWGGSRQGRYSNLLVQYYTDTGVLIIRDQNSRFLGLTSQRNTNDGLGIYSANDTSWEDSYFPYNGRNGVRVQPWAGNGITGDQNNGPVGSGVGGIKFTNCEGQYNGRHNFYGTAGSGTVVISSTDTDEGVDELDFHGLPSVRVGTWWESYFHNCGWANNATGSPAVVWRNIPITSIVQDTTNTLEIKVTSFVPHNFTRGWAVENTAFQFSGTSYDGIQPRSGVTYIVKEVYDVNTFAVNVAYAQNWNGAAVLQTADWNFKVSGQTKGYSVANLLDLFFVGRNINTTYIANAAKIYMQTSRLKIQIVFGPNVVGMFGDHSLGIFPSVLNTDTYVPVMGPGAAGGFVRAGLRLFGVGWPGWGSTSNPIMPDNIGWSAERPLAESALRTDYASGAARNFYAVQMRSDGAYFGQVDEQADAWTGWQMSAAQGLYWYIAGAQNALFDNDGTARFGPGATSSTNPSAGNASSNRDGVTISSTLAPINAGGWQRPVALFNRMNTDGYIVECFYNGVLVVNISTDRANFLVPLMAGAVATSSTNPFAGTATDNRDGVTLNSVPYPINAGGFERPVSALNRMGNDGYIEQWGYNGVIVGGVSTNRVAFSLPMALGGTVPDTSAALDVQSTTGFVILPRMTTTQANAVGNIQDGSIYYDTTLTKFRVRENGAWVNV